MKNVPVFFNTTHTLEDKIVLKVKLKYDSRLARLFARLRDDNSFYIISTRVFVYGLLKYSRRFAAILDNLHEIILAIASR